MCVFFYKKYEVIAFMARNLNDKLKDRKRHTIYFFFPSRNTYVIFVYDNLR